MERALKIPEVVSMIVQNLSDDPEARGQPRRIDKTTSFSFDLSHIARVAKIWWQPAVRGLYHDVDTYHVNLLLKILDEDWTRLNIPRLPANESTRKKFNRFLNYTKHIRMVRAFVVHDPEHKLDLSCDLCTASSFRELERLAALYESTCPLFPGLRSVSLSVWDHASLRAAVILLQPRLRWVGCVFANGAIPYVPNFLVAMAQRAPNVTSLSFEPTIPASDHLVISTLLGALPNLMHIGLYYPTASHRVLTPLNKLRALEKLALNLHPDPNVIRQILHFPSLRDIWLFGNPDAIITFVEGSELPQLSRLHITAHSEYLLSWREMLRALEDRIRPELRQLVVEIDPLPEEDEQPGGADKPTADFLPFGAFPNLKELRIVEQRRKYLRFSEQGFGVDEETLLRIQGAWSGLERLRVKHESWVWTDVVPPVALSFDQIIKAATRESAKLRQTVLVVESATLPEMARTSTPVPYAYLTLSRLAEDDASEESGQHGGFKFDVRVEWDEMSEQDIIPRSVSLRLAYTAETEAVICEV